ncbi:Apocarotenoid-15,15'-oxygenase [Okeania hirsuta]|uniref:Apocarotenoid-15,15'-oxygenase n=1 Tax=Okeania hirsuta TaxID=1458930 RepID=A0A3N6PES7_9CYAN|nr:carotenoid oxygenase family protein [Okeania hirsuta]RQH45455.1 Apocarotenoid-15,15'-oxygenase [Okeania hirsuta]
MTNLQIEKSTSYTREDWKKGYESQPNEYSYWIDDIEGEIPADLNGTFFRNGPGLLDINGQAIAHPFDGDGMVCAIGFKNGRAYFRNTFVKTEGYVTEKAAGKILYRGFGAQKPGGWLANIFDVNVKNCANTGILYWGDKLLALWEPGQPHHLNPQNLETINLSDLDGVLQPGQAFSAHPRIDKGKDGKGDVLVNFSVKPGLSTTITIFELNSQGKLLKRYSNSIPGFAFLHDMAITPNYCIFFQNPLTFNPFPFFLGLQSAGQCLEFLPNKSTQVILIPRDGSKAMKILETKPCFIFHHANAWEKNGEIYVDSICYESFPQVDMGDDFRELDFDSIPASQLWRFKINLSENNVEHKLLESRCCDFPNLNPNNVGEAYRYLFIGLAEQPSGNAPLQAILKIDWQTGERQIFSVAPRGFAGEPLFVPFPNGVNEDDGWLLMLMYDAAEHRSDVVILDARDLNQKPVARLHLKHHIPYGLHGSFTPHYFWE